LEAIIMKSLAYALVLLAATAATMSVRAQPTGVAPGRKSPEIAGEVERAGAQIQVILTNRSDTRAFQGEAKVSVGLSPDTAVEITVTLGPNETRRFPVLTPNTSGNEYSLAVYNQTRNLVLFKIAPFSSGAVMVREPVRNLEPEPEPAKGASDLRVTAKLLRSIVNKEAENDSTQQDESPVLTFEIETGTPVKDAVFTLSAREFQRREQFSIDDHASLEFKLPETLRERKLSFTITSSTGQKLTGGEVDLDQLPASDQISMNRTYLSNPRSGLNSAPRNKITSLITRLRRARRADLGNLLGNAGDRGSVDRFRLFDGMFR
jgi:hypothetical protein